ncbi:MAG: hypothetical protein MK107_13155 [Oceanicola sp.]|nr:hypothetical protein [Oceanicola sp.]
MIARLQQALQKAPLLTLAFIAALALTLWFGGRFTMQAVYWADPRHQQQEIEGWMTLGYIGRSWQVPPPVLADALEAAHALEQRHRYPPLARLSQRSDVPLADLIATLDAAIAAHLAQEAARP